MSKGGMQFFQLIIRKPVVIQSYLIVFVVNA